MANWYMKGQSEYIAANFHMGFYIDHSGFPEGDYDTRNIESHGQTSDPFMAFGIDTGPATWTYGQQQVEIGLLKSHRLKFDTSGVFIWAGPGQDDWSVLTGGTHALDAHSDVVITGTPADNELLAWDNATTKWINQTAAEAGLSATGHNHAHNDLTGLNDGDNYEHITQAQKTALHTIYSLEVHNNTYHDPDYKVDFSENTGFNKNFGTLGTEVCVGNDGRLSDSRTPLAHVLGTSGPHTGSLPLTDIASWVQGSIIKGGVSDWEALGKGTQNYVLKAGVSDIAWGQVAWGEVTGKPTEFTPEAHILATTGPHTGTLPWGDLSKTGSSLADLVTRAHSNLSDAPTSAHHVRYADSEAVSAVATADVYVKLVGDVMNGNLVMADGIEICLGAGSDMKLGVDQGGTPDHFIRCYRHGGTFTLQGEDIGGVMRDILTADPDVGTKLYYAGTEKLATTNTGVSISGDLTVNNLITAGNVDGVDVSDLKDNVDALIEQSTTFPGSPSEGDFHYDEDDDSLYRYNAEALAWVEVGVSGNLGNSVDLALGYVMNAPERTRTGGYALVKETTLTINLSSVQISWEVKTNNNSYVGYTKVYVNDIAISGAYACWSTTYAKITYTLSGLSSGDKVQIYAYNLSHITYVKNLIIGDIGTINASY